MKLGYIKNRFKYPKELQMEALTKYGCDKIYESPANNIGYTKDQFSTEIQIGDILVVYNLVVLSESLYDLVDTLAYLKEVGVSLHLISEELMIDQSYTIEQLLKIMLDFTNELRYNRQQEGIKEAKLKGKHIGRKPKLSKKTTQKAIQYREKYSIEKVAKIYGVGKSTLLRHISNYGLKSA